MQREATLTRERTEPVRARPGAPAPAGPPPPSSGADAELDSIAAGWPPDVHLPENDEEVEC